MIRSLLHILFGFTLLLSSAGVFVSKHYCKDQLKDWSVYAKAKPCHTGASCPMHASMPDSSKSKGCCDDQTSFVKSDQDQVCLLSDLDQETAQEWVHSAIVELTERPPERDRKSLKFFNHRPPLIVIKPAPLLQVFRF